jgi:hypothetical protein
MKTVFVNNRSEIFDEKALKGMKKIQKRVEKTLAEGYTIIEEII